MHDENTMYQGKGKIN